MARISLHWNGVSKVKENKNIASHRGRLAGWCDHAFRLGCCSYQETLKVSVSQDEEDLIKMAWRSFFPCSERHSYKAVSTWGHES